MARRTRRPRGVTVKTPEQLEAMRLAGLVVGRTLERLVTAVAPGVTTGELDRIAEESIRSAGAVPSFLGYHGFPASICTSIGAEVVHGIPSYGRELAEGELLSIDCGAILRGWHGDAAVTVPVGRCAPELLALSAVARDALRAGLAAAQPGAGCPTSATRCTTSYARTATALSRTTPGTASARRCTSRPASRTSLRRALGGGWPSRWGSCWPSSRW